MHFDFLKRLKEKYPTITPREMDLATYLLMNMSTKEIDLEGLETLNVIEKANKFNKLDSLNFFQKF